MATDISRRDALRRFAGLAVTGTMGSLWSPAGLFAKDADDSGWILLLGCAKDADGSFYAAVADAAGQLCVKHPLPDRGHGVAAQRNGDLAFAVARRPGRFIEAFNYKNGEHVATATPGKGNYFYGHAVLSADEKTLYATEGNETSSTGLIGIFDVENGLVRTDEILGIGIGPHELAIFDSNTLVVAVGGIHTRQRRKMNLDTMSPSLMYVSLREKRVTEQVSLPDHRLSIRHLAVANGLVITGQQYQGDSSDNVLPLVATHSPGGDYRLLEASWSEWRRFNGYIASVTGTDKLIVATSPRGGCYGCWDRESGKLLSLSSLSDVAGASATDVVWLSSGVGSVVNLKMDTSVGSASKEQFYSEVLWDNHLTAVLSC